MIQFRRFAALIAGAWLAGSLFMEITAIDNFRSVERFLADPGIPSAALIHGAGRENVRILLRRAAGESNAWLFEQWEWVQLGMGLALVLVLIFGERPPKLPIALCLAMVILVMIERFAFTPNLVNLGRSIDFLPASPDSPERRSFTFFHMAYTAVDLAKLAMGFAIAGILIIRPRPDPQMFARDAGALPEL